MLQRKEYQAPEAIELGQAAKLTLGAQGCRMDAYCCKENPKPAE